jgi:hypothetical protein
VDAKVSAAQTIRGALGPAENKLEVHPPPNAHVVPSALGLANGPPVVEQHAGAVNLHVSTSGETMCLPSSATVGPATQAIVDVAGVLVNLLPGREPDPHQAVMHMAARQQVDDSSRFGHAVPSPTDAAFEPKETKHAQGSALAAGTAQQVRGMWRPKEAPGPLERYMLEQGIGHITEPSIFGPAETWTLEEVRNLPRHTRIALLKSRESQIGMDLRTKWDDDFFLLQRYIERDHQDSLDIDIPRLSPVQHAGYLQRRDELRRTLRETDESKIKIFKSMKPAFMTKQKKERLDQDRQNVVNQLRELNVKQATSTFGEVQAGRRALQKEQRDFGRLRYEEVHERNTHIEVENELYALGILRVSADELPASTINVSYSAKGNLGELALPNAEFPQHHSHLHIDPFTGIMTTQHIEVDAPCVHRFVFANSDGTEYVHQVTFNSGHPTPGVKRVEPRWISPRLEQECATLQDGKVRLGKGAINTVYSATATLADGSDFPGVYKKENSHIEEWKRPISTLRNVAASKLNRRIFSGDGVLASTYLVRNGGELGCIMARANGVSPRHTGNKEERDRPDLAKALLKMPEERRHAFALSKGFTGLRIEGNTVTLLNEPENSGAQQYRNKIDFSDSDLRRELNKLQWFDSLTLGTDRHPENYCVGRDEQGRTRVTGFDNDDAFSAMEITLDKLPYASLPRLPKVIDRDTADAMLRLQPQHIEEDCIGLTREEIEASKIRLEHIKRAILGGKCLILEPNASWSTPQVSRALGVEPYDRWDDSDGVARFMAAAGDTSYVARETATQLQVLATGGMYYAPGELERLALGSQQEGVPT